MSFDREKISFIKALDALVDYHNLMRGYMTTTPVTTTTSTTKKPNKFVSFLDAIGHDFKVGLDKILPVAETAGETAISLFAPQLSPLFNQTVAAVVTAEQSAAAVGQQSGTGTQKLASVIALMGPLIAQSLADAGKSNDDAAVQKYISAVVTILNAVPAPAPAAAPAQAQIATTLPASTLAPVIVSAPAPAADEPAAITGILQQE